MKDVNLYQELAMKTSASNDSYDKILNGVMGLNGEAGECIDIVKKYVFQGHELNKEKLIDELGDVCWYIASIASGLDVSLDFVLEHNINKLKQRYPEGFFTSERSVNRDEK